MSVDVEEIVVGELIKVYNTIEGRSGLARIRN